MSETPKTPAPLTSADLAEMRACTARLLGRTFTVRAADGEGQAEAYRAEADIQSLYRDHRLLIDEVESLWELFGDLTIDEDALARAFERGREEEKWKAARWEKMMTEEVAYWENRPGKGSAQVAHLLKCLIARMAKEDAHQEAAP